MNIPVSIGELYTMQHALNVAADAFRRDREVMRAAGNQRLVDQFDRQYSETVNLAVRVQSIIEQEV